MKKTTTQFVFVADEKGMQFSFPAMKTMLKDTACTLSLLYLSQNNKFIFQKELQVLCSHFPERLMLFYETDFAAPGSLLETLEVLINANTSDTIKFLLVVPEEDQYPISTRLYFLGVSEKDIQTIF